jgi:hypothetical protein
VGFGGAEGPRFDRKGNAGTWDCDKQVRCQDFLKGVLFYDRTNHEVLRYVGGKISPEMQMPKLLWLKRNLSQEKWENVKHFMDLPDFLSWKATGDATRFAGSLA